MRDVNSRRLFGAAFFCVIILGWGTSAKAVPAFARQTGMPCTSCHIGTDSAPDFTRTGRLFSIYGYQVPVIRERISYEGDTVKDKPQYGGDYLKLNWMDFFSMRFISDFMDTGHNLDGTKQVTTSKPLARLSMFFTGPITDWLGLWTELGYLGNNDLDSVSVGHTGPTGLNLFAYDEYRLTATFHYGTDSIWGIAAGNEVPDVTAQFYPDALFTPRPWGFGQGGIGQSMDIASFTAHTLWHNRLWLQAGPVTGLNNLSWSNGVDWWGSVGWDFFRKQSNDLWLVAMYLGGKDAPSMLKPEKDSYICPTTCPPGVTDSQLSITNVLGGTLSQGVVVANAPVELVKHFDSYKVMLESSVADRGVNSWLASLAVGGMHQSYVSGANAKYDQVGFDVRYFYKRTYGFDLGWYTMIDYTYTTPEGVERQTEGDKNIYGLTLLWNPAMNVSLHLQFSPRSTNIVFRDDQRAVYMDGGKSEQLGIEYNF